MKMGRIWALAFICICGSTRLFAADLEIYSLTVSWVNDAEGRSTGIDGSDVTLKKTSTGQTETLGNVRLMFSGKISPSCVNMASHSASGTAKLAIAVFPGNSRFEIGEIPTYRIDATSVYSCGLKKGR